MVWKPNVTVAAVVERDGKYLLVEEETELGLAFNQPAGHLEEGEALIDAVVREALGRGVPRAQIRLEKFGPDKRAASAPSPSPASPTTTMSPSSSRR